MDAREAAPSTPSPCVFLRCQPIRCPPIRSPRSRSSRAAQAWPSTSPTRMSRTSLGTSAPCTSGAAALPAQALARRRPLPHASSPPSSSCSSSCTGRRSPTAALGSTVPAWHCWWTRWRMLSSGWQGWLSLSTASMMPLSAMALRHSTTRDYRASTATMRSSRSCTGSLRLQSSVSSLAVHCRL